MHKPEVGHKFLAKLGKKRLRPGGRKATEWLLAQAQFNKGSQVLEIACNMGTTAIEIARRYQCSITGIDRDEKALQKARDNIAQQELEHLISVQSANAFELPFADNSFDIVINEAMLTMYSLESKIGLLKEYIRILKPGGRLLTHDIVLLAEEEKVKQQIQEAIHLHVQPMSKPEWIALFKQIGFSRIEMSQGAMSLLSPTGMIRDEGVLGTLKIIRNALKKENRPQFFKMFKTFRRNHHALNYIALCSTKPPN